MTWTLRCQVTTDNLPALAELLDQVSEGLGAPTLDIDDALFLAGMRGRPEANWCPWPRDEVHIRVPGDSTRGASIHLRKRGPSKLEAQVLHRPLGTFTDWQLAVETAACLAERAGTGVEEDDGQVLLPNEFRAARLEDETAYLAYCVEGLIDLKAKGVPQGEVCTLVGPGHSCHVGPRVWAELPRDASLDDRALALVEILRKAVEGEGLDGFREATPLLLQGKNESEVRAAVLAPDVASLYRDPDYLLISPDLEGGGNDSLYLLPFSEAGDALPGLCTWLDDRTVGVSSIPRSQWPQFFASLVPRLRNVQETLDGAKAPHDPMRGRSLSDIEAEAAAAIAALRPQRGWWKLW